MTRQRWRVAAGLATVAAALGPASPVAAHTGSDGPVTSNYLTRITEVAPAVTGLRVEIVDVAGMIQLDWSGAGELIVAGYQGEPYLRLTATGAEQNMASPATYLNEDRFGRVDAPATADADAPPRWQRVSDVPNVRWHDHRAHWMGEQRPPQVAADPDRAHVVFDRWEIPVTVDGAPATIAGDLTWHPPPRRALWLAAMGALAIGFTALLLTRRWVPAAAALAAGATVVVGLDTLAYVRAAPSPSATQVAMGIGWTALAAGAAAVIVVAAVRRATPSPLAVVAAGTVIGYIGGLDRLDVVANSQIQTDLPATWARGAAILAVAVGFALVVRAVIDVAVLLRGPARAEVGTAR